MDTRYAEDLARHVKTFLNNKREKTPSLEVLTQLLETLFFASLKQEESRPTSCRVAFIDRHNPDPKRPHGYIESDRWQHFKLSHDLPFTVSNLVKLSQAVDPWGSTLAIDADKKGRLHIWGLIDQSVHFSAFLVKETSIGPEMAGMFQAVIEGVGEVSAYKTDILLGTLKQGSLVTHQHRVFQKGPIHSKMMQYVEAYRQIVKESAGQDKDLHESLDHWDDGLEEFWISALCRLLIGIHRHGHGGAVLISDEATDLNPKYSLKYPRLADALVRLGVHEIRKSYYSNVLLERYVNKNADKMPVDLYTNESVAAYQLGDANNEVKGCLRFLTSLSRVDGLLWLNSDLSLQGFGVEITLQKDPSSVFAALNSDGTKRKRLVPNHYGMRHRSMLRYCGSHKAAVGFVVSQDGDVRTITKVHDAVLLWDRTRLQSVRTPRSRHPR